MTLLYINLSILIPIFGFCLSQTVENCTQLYFNVSWKPENLKNKSLPQMNWNLIIISHMVFSLLFFGNFYPMINTLLSFGSCKGWTVQNHLSKPLGSQEILKNEVHTFFWNTLYVLLFVIWSDMFYMWNVQSTHETFAKCENPATSLISFISESQLYFLIYDFSIVVGL